MNKKPLLITGIILLAIMLGIGYLLQSGSDEDAQRQTDTSSTPQNEIITSDDEIPPQPPGTYIDYSADVLSRTEGTRLLFFHAPWCPQCRALEADIESNSIPSGVTIIKVDYDSNQALRQKYGVTIQTTVVKVDDDGNLVDKFVAYGEPTLAEVVDNLL